MLAQLSFTSGTTGKPKLIGVASSLAGPHEHRARLKAGEHVGMAPLGKEIVYSKIAVVNPVCKTLFASILPAYRASGLRG